MFVVVTLPSADLGCHGMKCGNVGPTTQEFPRSSVNDYKENELLNMGDETLGSALLSPDEHIDSSEN